MAKKQNENVRANEAEIEGLLDRKDVDEEGYVKITAGIASHSGWYIRVHEDSIVAETPPLTNPDYEQLGPLQVITILRDGTFKSRGNNTILPLKEFFKNLKAVKALTVSLTTTYKKLGG